MFISILYIINKIHVIKLVYKPLARDGALRPPYIRVSVLLKYLIKLTESLKAFQIYRALDIRIFLGSKYDFMLKWQSVTLGELLPDGTVRIEEGLQKDEVVATSGLRFLSDGMEVSISERGKR